jgi:hypothetical protein
MIEHLVPALQVSVLRPYWRKLLFTQPRRK